MRYVLSRLESGEIQRISQMTIIETKTIIEMINPHYRRGLKVFQMLGYTTNLHREQGLRLLLVSLELTLLGPR